MNAKQWIYQKIKEFFQENHGVPNNDTATQAMDLYEHVMEVTGNSRSEDAQMDEQIRNIFNYLFMIVHAAEAEHKPL